MKRLASLLAAIACISTLAISQAAPAAALPVGPQPDAPTAPNILVTAIVGTPLLNALEIYNQSNSPINLAGWSFSFTAKDFSGCSGGRTASIAFPPGWILAKNYLTFVRGGDPATATVFTADPNLLTGCVSPWLASIQIFQAGTVEQTISIPSNPAPLSLTTGVKQKQRDNSSSSARTLSGTFNSDYASLSSSDTTFFSDPLYTPPPDSAGLQVVEMLPHSLSCSPTNTSLACSDYVKLRNSTDKPIDLSAYRLRTSYDGTKSTSSNTIALNGTLSPGTFTLVNTKNDGTALSLTESGGYVWLEDVNGAKIYNPVIQYADASSTSKVGWAWAFDGATWRWTSDPTAQANNFPPEDQATTAASTTSALKPCAADQYRNPETNRCRKIVISASTLVPCKPDQERNPATSRCRSILASSASLQPCKSGQERNPATNRCRSVLGASTSLKPCAAGWQRNPQTNRCRKTTASSVANVQDIKTAASSANVGYWRWLLAAAAVIGAIGYAFYEWRQDLTLFLDKLKTKLARFIPGRLQRATTKIKS